MKKKRVIVIILVLITAALFVWRIWPHSLRDILDANDEPFDSIIIHISENSVVNGYPQIDSYRMEFSPADSAQYSHIMSLLEGTKYRSGFRNLLPQNNSAIGSGSHFATLAITGANCDASCYISYYDSQAELFYIGTDSGFLVYHPTNRTVLNQLLTYTTERGVLQD